VGNAGNANDPATGNLYGGVAYDFKIGTYDVTNSQYVEFLNTKDPTGANALGLWNSGMESAYGGINYVSGNANGNKFTLIAGQANHPVNFVSWYSSIRFTNWLNNGQGSGDTETGAYTLGALGPGGVPTNGNSITRNSGATVFLPNESEWYKAAYYNPGTSSYYQYATSSNTLPTASAPTALPNHANYNGTLPTDVGAYTGTTSPYGAFDMNGNVFQWNEDLVSSTRVTRGGSFGLNSVYLLSSSRSDISPTGEISGQGFRVATVVPEPRSIVALLFVVACGLGWARRYRV
jgi:formylglycine-generating enzyme required for sulfatase activity